jgi:multidrug resistance efflux pump
MPETQLPIAATVSKAESWLKAHERLIIVTFILIFAFFVLDKAMSIVSQWEQHKANEATLTLAADKAKADAELAQAKQMLSDYEAAISQTEKLNATLQAGIISRDSLLAAQQKKDSVLLPSELSERWVGLVGDSGIQSGTSGFTVSDTAAHATVSKLEQVPVLEKDLKDEQAKSANLQGDVDKANDLIGQGKLVVSGLQLQLTDKDKVCSTQVAAIKAEARKGKLKWFGIGFVSGFVAGHIW